MIDASTLEDSLRTIAMQVLEEAKSESELKRYQDVIDQRFTLGENGTREALEALYRELSGGVRSAMRAGYQEQLIPGPAMREEQMDAEIRAAMEASRQQFEQEQELRSQMLQEQEDFQRQIVQEQQ